MKSSIFCVGQKVIFKSLSLGNVSGIVKGIDLECKVGMIIDDNNYQ